MKFTRARNCVQCNYSINNKPIAQVSTHKHLGVVLSDDLLWKPHILSRLARSNRLLGLPTLIFGLHHEALLKSYKVMIRPILENASQVWNPHQAYLIDKLLLETLMTLCPSVKGNLEIPTLINFTSLFFALTYLNTISGTDI